MNAAQTLAFFTDATQMGLPNASFDFLLSEGISSLSDLMDADHAMIDTIATNARKPHDRVPHPNPPANAAANLTIPRPPCPFPARAISRLKTAITCLGYYKKVGRPITPDAMRWPTLKCFIEHWDIVETKMKADNGPIPRVDKKEKSLRIFGQHFGEWMITNTGTQGAPYSYVIRDEATPALPLPPLLLDQPFSEEYGSVEHELIARCTHAHPAFKTDNNTVFDVLERSLRNTQFYATVRPHSRKKDGRAAWASIKAQYLGEDKWRQELKECEDILNNRIWKGTSHMTLETFINLLRSAYARMWAAAEHTPFQLPDGMRQVERLLQNIHCNDPELRAAIAHVRTQTGPGGAMTSFEACVCQLLPHCPVIRLRKTRGNGTADQINGYVAAVNLNAGKGDTGVEFRYHSKAEYARLPAEQKEELRNFRNARAKAGLSPKLSEQGKRKGKPFGNGNITNKKMKAQVKSAVTQVITNLFATAEEKDDATLLGSIGATTGKPAPKNEVNMNDVIGRLRNNLASKGKSQK